MNGPLIDGFAENVANQFKRAKKVGIWEISCEQPDNCIFLSDLSLVIVENIVKTRRNQTLIIGKKFLVVENCFEYPVPSSDIYEFKLSTLPVRGI